jgi:hypothetical protein
MQDEQLSVEARSGLETKKVRDKEEIVRIIQEKMTEPTRNPECAHNFGYLSQRSNRENVPEECMVCERMLDCMLGAVKKKAED